MKSPYEMLKEWHTVMDPENGSLDDVELVNLRWDLIAEEFDEVYDELYPDSDFWDEKTFKIIEKDIDPKKLTKELADLMYVVIGCAVKFNLPLEEVFAEVHKSNMTKVNPDGTINRRADGKILKPATYKAPDLNRYFK